MKIFAANWKLNKNPAQTQEFFKAFLPSTGPSADKQTVFFVPSTNLQAAVDSVSGSHIKIGSQNCFWQNSGAFTGETSAQVVQQIGGQWILLGHSERRSLFAETSEQISKKSQAVQQLKMIPLVCIGETLNERESGKTFAILEKQLTESLALSLPDSELHIAYEPVWAIGTGKIASAEQVQETHAFVRQFLNKLGFKKSLILYGGSVKADNSKQLLSIPNVDGFLVGGASLEPRSFLDIINA